jgi:hypothetical protein
MWTQLGRPGVFGTNGHAQESLQLKERWGIEFSLAVPNRIQADPGRLGFSNSVQSIPRCMHFSHPLPTDY